MKFLINIKIKTEKFITAHLGLSMYVLRLVTMLICLLILSKNLGYNRFLSNAILVIVLSAASAFIPIRFLPPVLLAYIAIQLFSLSVGPAVVIVGVLILMYLIYFRFRNEYIYVVVFMPILFMMKCQLFIVLILAAIAAYESLSSIVMGVIVYYLIHYINVNATVLNKTSGIGEMTKINMVLQGTIISRDFLIMLAILIIVFILVHIICGINVSKANFIAVIVGAASYIILQIVSELLLLAITGNMNITYSRLWAMLLGAVLSMIAALIVTGVMIPQDYSRTVMLKFDDEEYYYYVRAVPKASFEKEPVRIKRINARKTQSDEGSTR